MKPASGDDLRKLHQVAELRQQRDLTLKALDGHTRGAAELSSLMSFLLAVTSAGSAAVLLTERRSLCRTDSIAVSRDMAQPFMADI
jgi:hypothetical protein